MTKVGSWAEHNKGLWAFTECPGLGTDDEGSICPALRRLKASFWPPVSESKDCCFMIRLPLEFRQSCYGLGGRNCILCLNALMLVWYGYVQVSLMLYSLKIIKLHNWIIKFVSPLEAVPECPSQSAVPWALKIAAPPVTLSLVFSTNLEWDYELDQIQAQFHYRVHCRWHGGDM